MDKRINARFQADFLLLISKLLKNGFSLNEAMRCLNIIDQKNLTYQRIYHDLEAGYMLSTALYHLKLPLIVHNQLMIAQMNGGLQQTVEQCGQILKQKFEQQNKLKELLAYPAFLISFLSLMMIAMKIYILPQLSTDQNNDQLDLYIKIFGGLFLLSILMFIFFVIHLNKLSEYDRAHVLIRLPLVKKGYLNFYQFSILQGFGMQFSQGLDLQKICLNNQNFVDGSIQNVLARKLLFCLKNGDSLQQVILQERLLPNELNMLLSLGSGGLEVGNDLLLMSELKFQKTKVEIKKIINLVQPLLFSVIAGFILIAYLMILLPVYSMMKGMN